MLQFCSIKNRLNVEKSGDLIGLKTGTINFNIPLGFSDVIKSKGWLF